MKILAIMPDGRERAMVADLALRAGGHELAHAGTATAALARLGNEAVDFDCVLIHADMPGMDAAAVCRQVRALPTYRAAPLIVLTARPESGIVERAFAAGATDFARSSDGRDLGARLRAAGQILAARRSQAAPATDDTGVVSRDALERHLAELSPAGLASSQVFAVRLDRFAAIAARGTGDAARAMGEVAQAVDRALSGQGGLLAPAGGGTILCVCSAPVLIDPARLEAEIAGAIDRQEATFDNGDPIDAQVSVGVPFRPWAGNGQPPRAILDRAAARAAVRSDQKRSAPKAPNIRMLRFV